MTLAPKCWISTILPLHVLILIDHLLTIWKHPVTLDKTSWNENVQVYGMGIYSFFVMIDLWPIDLFFMTNIDDDLSKNL